MNSGMRRRRAWVLAAVAFAVAAVVALSLGTLNARLEPPAPAKTLDRLSIALPLAPHSALAYIAAGNGYFAAEGLEVTLMPVSHGRVGIDLAIQGKADLAMATEVPFVISVMKGEALGIAANTLSVLDDHALVARRDRGIAAPRDLPGRKIGVTFGTSGEYFLWAFLIRHKITPDLVALVDLPPGRIAQALAGGAVDAVATWQPIAPEARTALGDNAVSFTSPTAYVQTYVVVGRSDFLKGHPRAIEKLIRALLKAEQFTRSQPEQALNLVAERLKIGAEALRPTWKDFDFKVDLQQSQLTTLEGQARWAMARGYAAPGPLPNFLPHLYLDALLAVQPGRVTVVR